MLHATKGAGTQHARRRRRWRIVLPTALRKRRYNKFVFSCRRAASISKHLFRHAHKEIEREREGERRGSRRGIEEDDPRLWLRLRLWLLRRRASVPPAKAVECGVCAICDQTALNYVVREGGPREREGETRLSLRGCVIYRQRRAAKWAFNLVCAATNRHSDRLKGKKKEHNRERETGGGDRERGSENEKCEMRNEFARLLLQL